MDIFVEYLDGSGGAFFSPAYGKISTSLILIVQNNKKQSRSSYNCWIAWWVRRSMFVTRLTFYEERWFHEFKTFKKKPSTQPNNNNPRGGPTRFDLRGVTLRRASQYRQARNTLSSFPRRILQIPASCPMPSGHFICMALPSTEDTWREVSK